MAVPGDVPAVYLLLYSMKRLEAAELIDSDFSSRYRVINVIRSSISA